MSIESIVAANRFGLGARPGELKTISTNPKAWLLAQLTPEETLPRPLAELPSTVDDQRAFAQWIGSIAKEAKAAGLDPYHLKPTNASTPLTPPVADGEMASGFSIEREFVKTFGPRHARAVKARFDTSVATDRPFFERLVHFWVNHFVVSGAKPAAIALPPSFERDAIRPNVTGKFLDMLMASSKHPAMLLYLDNFQSVGPNSKLGLDPSIRPARNAQPFAVPKSTGLNENLAREIMELQTLGVRSGYTQADVTNFAKSITGWTIARPPIVPVWQLIAQNRLNGKGLFQFDEIAHEPGLQTIMGRVYAQTGVDQGEAVLTDLARHPKTAEFIATKLVRHFISDDPPPAAVERIARVFRETDGDLGKVCAALVESPEAYSQVSQKFKTPDDYMISTARALPGFSIDTKSLLQAYASMGEKPYNPPGPNGWPDSEAEWIGADAIWKRFQWVHQIAQNIATTELDPAALAPEILGQTISQATLETIQRAQNPTQGLTLLLASAEFQRR